MIGGTYSLCEKSVEVVSKGKVNMDVHFNNNVFFTLGSKWIKWFGSNNYLIQLFDPMDLIQCQSIKICLFWLHKSAGVKIPTKSQTLTKIMVSKHRCLRRCNGILLGSENHSFCLIICTLSKLPQRRIPQKHCSSSMMQPLWNMLEL